MEEDPEYTALCSSKTLQSQEQGFFSNFADQVSEAVGSKWIESKFGALQSDEARVQACWGLGDCVHVVLNNVQPLYRGKDGAVSACKLQEGDIYLAAGDPKRALMVYNHAVMRAPSPAAAVAARSEALLQLEEYDKSIADIQLAIREGFPTELRYQLYWRMGRCYRGLGNVPKARVSLQLASTLLMDNKEQIGTMEFIASTARLNNELSQLEMEQTCTPPPGNSSAPVLPAVSGGSNPAMPAASCNVGVESSPDHGRYAVATDHITTGDTVVVEAPYAAVLLPDKFGTHCHHCFNRLLAPVPCTQCSGVAFCSVSCRNAASMTYHRYECHYMDLMVGSGMSILCHLALRMVTQSGLQQFRDIKHSLKESFLQPTTDPGKYSSVYNLVTHADKRPAQDFLHRTLMSLFLLRCLQDANFFNKNNNRDLDDDQLYIGSLLLRHLQLLQFNAHEIFETCMEAPNKFRGSKTMYLAVGIYPTVAMFNHDCHPALARYFIGKSIVLQALRPLKPGDIVAENYGPIFTKRPLHVRQKTLSSRYWFKCSCQACKEDWPTYDTLNNDNFRFRCPTQGCTQLSRKGHRHCPKCKKQVVLEEGIVESMSEQFLRGMDKMEAGEVDQATQLFCSYLDTMYRVGAAPCRDMSLCQDALRGCLSIRGNTWIVRK